MANIPNIKIKGLDIKDVEEINESRPSFFAPSPTGEITTRDVVRELPSATAQVGKDIGQSFARSFGAASNVVADVFRGAVGKEKQPFIPQPGVEQKIFGKPEDIPGEREDISFTSIGDEILALFGKGGSKMALPIGLVFGGLDLIPGIGTGAKSILRQIAKNVAKTKNIDEIIGELTKVYRGSDEEIFELARGLAKVGDEAQVVKILDNIAPEKAIDPRAASLAEADQRFAQQQGDILRADAEVIARRQDVALRQPVTPSVVKEIVEPAARGVITDERKLVQQRLKALETGGKIGRKEATREIKNLQETVVKAASELPVAMHRGLLKAVTRATTAKKAIPVFDKVFDKIDLHKQAVALSKRLNTEKQKIAFIKKMGELSFKTVRHAKEQLGIKTPINKIRDPKELEALSKALLEKTRIRAEKGYKTISQKGVPEKTTEAEYAQAVDIAAENQKFLTRTKRKTGDILKDSKRVVSKALGVISTELKKVSPALKAELRNTIHRKDIKQVENLKKAKPFLDKFNKLQKTDFDDWVKLDLAMKNREGSIAMKLIIKHEMLDEFETMTRVLDDLYARMIKSGVDVNYLKGHIPRLVNDSDGFYEFMSKSPGWAKLEEAIRAEEIALGVKELDKTLRVKIINSLVKGYKKDTTTLPTDVAGIIKSRRIEKITPEMNQYYANSINAVEHYIKTAEDQIAFAEFFGKNMSRKIKKGEVVVDQDIAGSIGPLIDELILTNKIRPQDMDVVKESLTAIFAPTGPGKFIAGYKNLTYATVMGSPINAITQIGDMAFTLYKNGMIKGIKGAFVRRLRKEDVGIEDISQEFTDIESGKRVVSEIFKWTGLRSIDNIGKNSMINGSFLRLKEQALKDPETLTKRFLDEGIIPERFIDNTIESLKRDELTENVRVLLASELAEVQPISLLETPLGYAAGGNARIFYMLKTWTIKALDVYRNDVIQQFRKNPVQAAKNLARLTALLVVLNATADEIKDFVRGKEDVKWNDRVIDNIIKVAGFNRYALNQAKQQGFVSTAFEQILPPSKIFDDLYKDVRNPGEKIRTLRSIPIGGELYYWWVGGGTSDAGGISIPGIDIPNIEIPNIDIPNIDI